MSVQAINSALMNVSNLVPEVPNAFGKTAKGSETGGMTAFSGKNAGSSLVVGSESFSVDKLVMQFQNSDGDSVTLSAEGVEYQKAILAANGINSKEDWQKLVDYLKEQYESLKSEIIKGFLKNNGQEVAETEETEASADIPGLPEYWNAENTSQRIVDFATSFISLFEGSGEEFLSMMKDAIEKGFAEAGEIMGELPDAVNSLVNNTHDLVMKKLDAWAQEQGITVAENEAAA